eukprot:scaffold13667_cov68-Phaeocystis_antarctica.AAC.7
MKPAHGSRFTPCPQCGRGYATYTFGEGHDCRAAMPLPMPPQPAPMTLGSSSHLGILMNPGGYRTDKGWLVPPHFSIVLPPLDPVVQHSEWCPDLNNVINLTMSMSDGQALALGKFVRPCVVEHFAKEQHAPRTSYASVADGVHKEVILKWHALVEVIEQDPRMAPQFKPALCVHVQPPSSRAFMIEIFFAGMGTRNLEEEVQPSRTDPWRTTGRVLSSGGGLWGVKLVGGLPPALVDGLVPRTLSLHHFGATL